MAKVLFLGDIGSGQTTLMRLRAFERLGLRVRGVNTVEPWRAASWSSRQIQRKLQTGFVINRINAAVLNASAQHRPDIVWAEKQEFLWSSTLEELRRRGALLIHFTPDPYFALSWKRTRLMDRAITRFDTLIYCKSYERAQYEALGKAVVYMPLGYCDEAHRPMMTQNPSREYSVGFVGGWEPRRELLLNAVAATGVNLKIYGRYWEFLVDGRWTLRRAIILNQLAGPETFRFHRSPVIAKAYQGDEIYGNAYARALSTASIGLGFLRQIIPEQHTTRTFEIPACGSLLLADRTSEHQAFFSEGREAEFFSSTEELVDKIKFYDRNERERRRITAAGLERCRRSGYAYVHRLSEVLKTLGITHLVPVASP